MSDASPPATASPRSATTAASGAGVSARSGGQRSSKASHPPTARSGAASEGGAATAASHVSAAAPARSHRSAKSNGSGAGVGAGAGAGAGAGTGASVPNLLLAAAFSGKAGDDDAAPTTAQSSASGKDSKKGGKRKPKTGAKRPPRDGKQLWRIARSRVLAVHTVKEQGRAAKLKGAAARMWRITKKRVAAATEELLEGESIGQKLLGVARGLATSTSAGDPGVAPKHVGPYTPMTSAERRQRWFDVWWEAARPPRKRQFSATVIQHAYADYLLRVAALERKCAYLISMAYLRYLARRQTRAYWHNYDISRIDRGALEFILKRIGRETGGQRARIERDFREYLMELPMLYETKRFAHKRHRLAEMGKAGAVFAFGSNHMGQLGVGDKVPCTYEPMVVRALAGMGCRVVAASPEGQTGYAISATGAVYSWGGGGVGAQGIDFELDKKVPRRGTKWYSKPVRVDRVQPDSEDKTFIDWTLRCNSTTTKSEREKERIRREVLRGRTPYAPDMAELTQAFEGLRRGTASERHFPEWRPSSVSAGGGDGPQRSSRAGPRKSGVSVGAATAHTATTLASRRGSTLPPRDTKVLDIRRRGRTLSGLFQSTRRNVFGYDGEVWLGVGTLQSNAVWISAGRSHAAVSLFEGGALMWGDNQHGHMGPVEIPDDDPTLYDQPQWIQALSQDFVAHLGCSRFHNAVVTSNGELLCWGLAENFKGAEKAVATHYLAVDDIPLYRWPSLRAVKMHQVHCGPSYAAAISDIGHLYTWGNGEGGKLGHGDTNGVPSPRLVRSLASKVVLAASCGVQHMAAIVEVPGVTAYVGYTNQPYREEYDMGRWGKLGVRPVTADALSYRRLNKVSKSARRTARTRASSLARWRPASLGQVDTGRTTGTPTARQRHAHTTRTGRRSRPGSSAAAERRLRRTMSSGALAPGAPTTSRPVTPGTPGGVPGGTVTYLRSRKAPSTYRRFDSDNRPLGLRGLPGEGDSTTSSDASWSGSEVERGTIGSSARGGSNPRDTTGRRPSTARSPPPKGSRKQLLNDRALPPVNNRVAPGTPAGALYTWGTGTYGQLGQKLEVSVWLPRPVEWGPKAMLGSGLTEAQIAVLGLGVNEDGALRPATPRRRQTDPDKDPSRQEVTVTDRKGIRTKRVVVDYQCNPSAVAREAGIGCTVDGDGVPVDRYRSKGLEEEIPGWLRARSQRQRLVEFVARKWMLDELVYRNRREFGVWQSATPTEGERPLVMVQAVSCGSRHTAAVSSKGEVFTFGCDHKGCLGRPMLGPILHDATRPQPLDEYQAKALLKAKKEDLLAGSAMKAARRQMGLASTSTVKEGSSTLSLDPLATTSSAALADDPWTAAAEKAKAGPFARHDDAPLEGTDDHKVELSLYGQRPPPGLRRMSLEAIANFAGVPPRHIPVNPFDLLTEIPGALVARWLGPRPLPGHVTEADEDTMMFRHKKLQGGRLGELALRKRSRANLDERQRSGQRPPPRTLTTLPRTTSAHPMPFREHSYYKQGVGARLLPGKRHQNLDGTVATPPERLRRHKKFEVEALDDVLTSALTLTHDRPHPDSFSRPRAQPYLQRDVQMHVSNRSMLFMDPRRRIGSPELLSIMRNWGREETAEEVKSPMQRLYEAQLTGGGPEAVQPLRKDTVYNFQPEFIGDEGATREWDGRAVINPALGVQQPLADKLRQDPGLVLGPVLVAAQASEAGVTASQEPLPSQPPVTFPRVPGVRVPMYSDTVSAEVKALPAPASPLRSAHALAPAKSPAPAPTPTPTPTPDVAARTQRSVRFQDEARRAAPLPSMPPASPIVSGGGTVGGAGAGGVGGAGAGGGAGGGAGAGAGAGTGASGGGAIVPVFGARAGGGGGGGIAGAYAAGAYVGGIRPQQLPAVPHGSRTAGGGDRSPAPPLAMPDLRTQRVPSANFDMSAATSPVGLSGPGMDGSTGNLALLAPDDPRYRLAESHGVAPMPQPQFSVHGNILPPPARPLYYVGIRERLYREPPPPKTKPEVRDPDLSREGFWDQRYIDSLNAHPDHYVYPEGFYDRMMRKKAAETGGELWLSGKKDIFSSFDARAVAARLGVDWHGIEQYVPGTRWNQWETGDGTGGGRIRPYITAEYERGINVDDSDRSSEAESEKEEEAKTLAEKRADRQGRPGFMPAPMIETWRWSSTPGRVVGIGDAGRACSVACGYDFTLVATLSRAYYDIVDEDFDDDSSGWSDSDFEWNSRPTTAASKRTSVATGFTGETARRRPPGPPPPSSRLSAQTSVRGSLGKRKPRPPAPAGPRPDVPRLPLSKPSGSRKPRASQGSAASGGTGRLSQLLTGKTAGTDDTFHTGSDLAGVDDRRRDGGDDSSSGPDDDQMLEWLRGMCRVCDKCLGFEPGGTLMFFCARCHHHKWLHGKRPAVTEEIQALFAIKIQRIFRANRAKAKFQELVREVIEKVRDPDTGVYYYYNKRTGESTWEKPKLLGNKDVPETFYSRRVDEHGNLTWIPDAELAAIAEAEAAAAAAAEADGSGGDADNGGGEGEAGAGGGGGRGGGGDGGAGGGGGGGAAAAAVGVHTVRFDDEDTDAGALADGEAEYSDLDSEAEEERAAGKRGASGKFQ